MAIGAPPAAGVAAMGADPCRSHGVQAVRTAGVGGGNARAMAGGAFRYAAGISLQVRAVESVVRLVGWVFGMLRTVASRAFDPTVTFAKPVQANAGAGRVGIGGEARIGARPLRPGRPDVGAGERAAIGGAVLVTEPEREEIATYPL
jgi:hypothetical protein